MSVAQAEKLVVTPAIKKLMRTADRFVVRCNHSQTARIEFQQGKDSLVSYTELALPISIRAFDKMGSSRVVCASESVGRFNELWSSILQVVRPGDQLSIYVVAGNSNQYLQRAELHHDEMYLQIDRKSGTIFMKMANSLCPNNSARMVR